MNPEPLIWVAGTAVVSTVLTRVAIGYASRRGLLDRPGPRRSHANSTPRGGGVAIVAAMLLAAIALALREPPAAVAAGWFGLGVLALAAVGFRDDHRPLPAWFRLGAQFVVAGLVIWGLGGVDRLAFGTWSTTGGWLSVLGLVALVWLINLFNFMDGIDGIASVEAAFVGLVFALFSLLDREPVGALLGALVAGACLGFLPWNFPRARIFMGDAGSYGVGFALGFLFLWGLKQGSFGLPMALACFGVFAVDATLTLGARIARRARWYTPHREHAYQLLVRGGWSHARVVAAVTVVNLLAIAPALLWARGAPAREAVVGTVVVVALAGLWLKIRFRYNFNKEQ